MRNGLAIGPSASPNARRTASACGAGSESTRAEHGPQELVQAGERQVGLGLQADRGEHRHVLAGRLDGVAQQRRLADAGLAAQDEHAAASAPSGFEQLLDALALAFPAAQACMCGECRHVRVAALPEHLERLGHAPVAGLLLLGLRDPPRVLLAVRVGQRVVALPRDSGPRRGRSPAPPARRPRAAPCRARCARRPCHRPPRPRPRAPLG